jgi:Zn-dependent protease
MSDVIAPPSVCARCGRLLAPADLVCPACGLLTHLERLQALSGQAQALEHQDPAAAIGYWRGCLELLPPASQQAEILRHRIMMLESGPGSAPPERRGFGYALMRTGGSMILSMVVYGLFLGPKFAIGFVLLIWVHEMGHVLALRRYGVRSAPPLFIPFVGAVITIGRVRDAAQEAIVGIGGPILGTVGALACFALYRVYHQPLLLDLSFYGFSINLLNLLPIPPLDGGRITAAVSPWIWPFGFLALIGLGIMQYIHAGRDISGVSPILLLIVVFAAPRLWRTFRYRERDAAYYRIPRSASWAIGTAYLLLAVLLMGMFYYTKQLGAG